MRFVLGFIVFFNTLLAVLLAVGFFYGYGAWVGAGPLSETKSIVIPRGAGVAVIADTLHENGVIKSPLVFKVAARITGDQAKLKAGEYEFPPYISTRAVLNKLVSGAVVQRKITIPEGWTSWQIVQFLNESEALTGSIAGIPPEGSLLPDTYIHEREADRTKIIATMDAAMKKTIEELWPGRAEGLPFTTVEEAVTLASIVEKETGIAAERARIAGVFVNRLRNGMPLQTDPTVIYAITKGQIKDDGQGPLGRRLLKKDLTDTDSPYNTYKYPGLPPGPIANPGRAALDAVLHPETHNFLYFVADGTGGHVFAATLAEHEANAVKWRAIRKEQGN
ncbi:MAG: endolytic transglycosylase MltG [Micavibrio sp.]